MNPEQIEIISSDVLLEKVRTKWENGCRLVQISATRLPDQVELTYSFDLTGRLENLRLSLPAENPRLRTLLPLPAVRDRRAGQCGATQEG